MAELAPVLDDRVAVCPYCKTERPSATTLAFFEYRGPGSRDAQNQCGNCGYYETAHLPLEQSTRVSGKSVVERGVCPGFKPMPEGRPTDSFYCGCRGWD